MALGKPSPHASPQSDGQTWRENYGSDYEKAIRKIPDACLYGDPFDTYKADHTCV